MSFFFQLLTGKTPAASPSTVSDENNEENTSSQSSPRTTSSSSSITSSSVVAAATGMAGLDSTPLQLKASNSLSIAAAASGSPQPQNQNHQHQQQQQSTAAEEEEIVTLLEPVTRVGTPAERETIKNQQQADDDTTKLQDEELVHHQLAGAAPGFSSFNVPLPIFTAPEKMSAADNTQQLQDVGDDDYSSTNSSAGGGIPSSTMDSTAAANVFSTQKQQRHRFNKFQRQAGAGAAHQGGRRLSEVKRLQEGLFLKDVLAYKEEDSGRRRNQVQPLPGSSSLAEDYEKMLNQYTSLSFHRTIQHALNGRTSGGRGAMKKKNSEKAIIAAAAADGNNKTNSKPPAGPTSIAAQKKKGKEVPISSRK